MDVFPTEPGSLIRATASDDRTPRPYFLAPDDAEDLVWVTSRDATETYRPDELTLIAVLHDEGRVPEAIEAADVDVETVWLEWFYANADFGPADDDVRDDLMDQFERETGLTLPAEYRAED